MSFLTRRKSIDGIADQEAHHTLKKTLSWPHLIALGVGAIVGTGIYTLIGVGANLAGPGVVLSFIIAGAVCACAALAYAELSTMMPAAGSAYTYSYAALGEMIAWVIGWSLILEYTVVCAAVAVGWAGYAAGFAESLHIALPHALLVGPHAGGIVNLPAILITWLVAGMLAVGTRESATVNAVLVAFKIVALVVFVVIAMPHFDAARFEPFMPYGFGGPFQTKGVMAAAAIIFFAFYGFDAVSTAAEETKNPGRDLTIGIVGSMIACTALYMLVAAAALGALSFTSFANSPEPLALILRTLGQPQAAAWIAAAAVIALPTVILAFLYGQSRIFFVMARDGLLPSRMASVNKRTGSPLLMTVFTAVVVSLIAGFFRLDEIAALANAGTLAAFVAVGACLLVLRKREPDRPRVFRTPMAWPVGLIAIGGCLYLFVSLPQATQIRFFIWNAIGLVIYFAWGAWNSRLARAKP